MPQQNLNLEQQHKQMSLSIPECLKVAGKYNANVQS